MVPVFLKRETLPWAMNALLDPIFHFAQSTILLA